MIKDKLKYIENIGRNFIEYLHLHDWLKQKALDLVLPSRKFAFQSISDFWRALLEGELSDGDRVSFSESFLSEWTPRAPGQIWAMARAEGKDVNDLLVADWFAYKSSAGIEHVPMHGFIYSIISQVPPLPLGVVRLPLLQTAATCAVLSLTTADYWLADLGIPVIVSRSVYDSFRSKQVKNWAVECSLEATLRFGEPLKLEPDLFRSIGAELKPAFLASITTPVGVPKVYLQLTSPIGIRFRTHDKHPHAFLWALTSEQPGFRTTPLLLMMGLRIDNPSDPEQTNAVAQHFTSHFDWMDGSFVELNYYPFGPFESLTEFDARMRHFATSIPIISRPWEQPAEKSLIVSTLKRMNEPPKPTGKNPVRDEHAFMYS